MNMTRKTETVQVAANADELTVTGIRTTMGNAVDCPEIRTDSNETYNVAHLPPDIQIGDRVSVTGRWVYPATCRGPVLSVEQLETIK